jgi:hypothetical protein
VNTAAPLKVVSVPILSISAASASTSALMAVLAAASLVSFAA